MPCKVFQTKGDKGEYYLQALRYGNNPSVQGWAYFS